MPLSPRAAALFLFFSAPLVFLPGCSSTADDSPSGATPDSGASPDASSPPDASPDAACVALPVWAVTDLDFTESDLGGFASQPPADAGCSINGVTYDFSAGDRTLRGRNCSFSGFADKTVTLTAAQLQVVLSAVEALRTDCPPSNRCGADYGSQTLTVTHGGGTPSSQYSGDFYAGCNSGSVPAGRYIDFMVLSDFEQTLGSMVFPSDAGGN